MTSEWLWGRRAVAEALRGTNRDVEELWIEEGPPSGALDELLARAEALGVASRTVDRTAFAGLDLVDAQRVAARCTPFRYKDEGDIPWQTDGHGVLVILDHLEDPQNTGAILRTCEAAGCLGACIPKKRAAQITPAVVRSSAGATEQLSIFRIGNVANLVDSLKDAGYWTVALDGDGDEPWDRVDYRGRIALIVGSEGKGVQRLVRERCDHRVALPMHGKIGSLNASAAFAAVVYEVVRQQGR